MAKGPLIDDELVWLLDTEVDSALFAALRKCTTDGYVDWVVIPRQADIGKRVRADFPREGMVGVMLA